MTRLFKSPSLRVLLFFCGLLFIRLFPTFFPYWNQTSEAWRVWSTASTVIEIALALILCLFIFRKMKPEWVVASFFIWIGTLNLLHTSVRRSLNVSFELHPNHSLESVLEQMRQREDAFVLTLYDALQYIKKNYPESVFYAANDNTVLASSWVAEVFGNVKTVLRTSYDSSLSPISYQRLLLLPHKRFPSETRSPNFAYPIRIFDDKIDSNQSNFFVYDFHGEAFLLSPHTTEQIKGLQ